EPVFLGQVGLDLPAKPDRPAAELRDGLGEAGVLLPAKRQRGSPDPGELGGLRKTDEVKRQFGRRLFGCFGSYRPPTSAHADISSSNAQLPLRGLADSARLSRGNPPLN